MKRGFVLKAHSVTTLLFVPDSLFCYSVILHLNSVTSLSFQSFPLFFSSICLISLPLCATERASLPRNMIENSMFEEEPDVVDLAKDSTAFPVCQYVRVDNVSELGQIVVSCFCLTMLSLHHGNTSYAVLVFSHRSDAASYSLIDKVFTLSHSLIVTKSSLKAPRSFCSCRKDSYNHY